MCFRLNGLEIILSNSRACRLFLFRRSWLGIFITAFLVLFIFSVPFISAQEGGAGSGVLEELKPEDMDLLAAEPPLTQADIDAIIKIADSEDDKPAPDLGLSPIRMELVLTKVSFGMLILAGADPKLVYGENINDVFVLSQDELKLIAVNLDRIAGGGP